jgi:hypothetical protein
MASRALMPWRVADQPISRALGHVTADPASIGSIAMAALVLTQIEHEMIS